MVPAPLHSERTPAESRRAPRSPGQLRVYLGALPWAGKTHAMLAEGMRPTRLGSDVVVALLETRGRSGLDDVAASLAVVPRRGAGRARLNRAAGHAGRLDGFDAETTNSRRA
jgi:K+-sensing histidine kinase KdpD